MNVQWPWWGLFAVATVDTFSSYWWLHIGIMTEANPLLEWSICHGLWLFLLVKMMLYVPFLLVIRMMPNKHEKFTNYMLKVGFWAYILLWCIGVALPILTQ